MNEIECRQCGGTMYKTKRGEHNLGLQFLGVVVFIIGLALLFVFPLGTIAGVFLMLGAARMGYSKKKVWMCRNCGYYFERE